MPRACASTPSTRARRPATVATHACNRSNARTPATLHDKELVSSQGYSHNQLILWKYPSMVRVAELRGHTSRVLQSPDGTTMATAAADETLRFWKILSGGEQNKKVRRRPRSKS